MRNDEVLPVLRHVTEVSHGHTVTPEHVESLKQWIRLEKDNAGSDMVLGLLVCENLIREVDNLHRTLPLHEATDPTPVENPTPPKARKKAAVKKESVGEGLGDSSSNEAPSKKTETSSSDPAPVEPPPVEVNGDPVPAPADEPVEVEEEEEATTELAAVGEW